MLAQLNARHHGHLLIRQHQVEVALLQRIQGVASVVDARHLEAGPHQLKQITPDSAALSSTTRIFALSFVIAVVPFIVVQPRWPILRTRSGGSAQPLVTCLSAARGLIFAAIGTLNLICKPTLNPRCLRNLA